MNRSRENLPDTISADWQSPIISTTIYLRVARRGSIIADVILLGKRHMVSKRLRWPIAVMLLLTSVAILVIFLQSNRALRYPNGSSYISNGNGNSASIHWTRVAAKSNELGELVYAFVAHPNFRFTSTSLRNGELPNPPPKGIYWVQNLPNGLWLDGNQIELPKDNKVFVICNDGTICPIEIGKSKQEALCSPSGGIVDEDLWNKLTSPALNTSAG